jgi:hypothetical protein
MTFRVVLVPAERLLGDRRVTLGGSNDRFNFSENYRRDYVAGGFSVDGGGGGRQFYIGKYEVTTDQYEAITGQDCVHPTNAGRLPKTSVSWSEAVVFSVRYTEWLYANAAEALPREDGVHGFLRLPTEAEWEYTARGGAAVSESEFLKPLFPLQDDLKATGRLTVNVGMRWDTQDPAHAVDDRYSNFDPYQVSPLAGTGTIPAGAKGVMLFQDRNGNGRYRRRGHRLVERRFQPRVRRRQAGRTRHQVQSQRTQT